MNQTNKIDSIIVIAVITAFVLLPIAYNFGFNDGARVSDAMAPTPVPTPEEPQYPRVSSNMNITLVNIKEFSIPGYGLILPANSTYRIGRLVWKGTISSPQSCEISIELLSVDRSKNQPPLYSLLPLTITYLETPCNSEGPTTKNIFHNSAPTSNRTFPALRATQSPVEPASSKMGVNITCYCHSGKAVIAIYQVVDGREYALYFHDFDAGEGVTKFYFQSPVVLAHGQTYKIVVFGRQTNLGLLEERLIQNWNGEVIQDFVVRERK